MKSAVRNNILTKLSSLSATEKKQHSTQIQQQLQDLLKDQSGHWVAYKNLSNEPQIQWSEVSDQIEWAFPKIRNDHLEFIQSHEFVKSEHGFAEPAGGLLLELDQISGFVIPAIAYDKQGHRLGRGKGFYDRSLRAYHGKKVGVCFNVSLCEEVPREEHDVQCDFVVTENQVYQVNKSEGVRKWN